MEIQNQNIVCLSSQDFDDLWTRKHRWMTRLSRDNRIFWVNLQMHAVTYFRKFPQTWRRPLQIKPRRIDERLWVYTPPITIPGFQMSRAICRIHNIVLNRLLRHHLRRLGFAHNILWLYTPYNAYQIGRLYDFRRVYECVDDFSAARGLINAAVVNHLESETLARANLVIATADRLADKFRSQSPNLFISHNAADFGHFNSASDNALSTATELLDIKGPVIGFLGSISYWVDVNLIAKLAGKRPDWTFVLLGPVRTGVSGLRRLPNVRIIGERPYRELPRYLKRFDVCLNPYKNDGVAEGASPLKLYEYLATGKPVVSSDMPEARLFSAVVEIARTPDEFIAKIENLLRTGNIDRRERQYRIARENSWDNRFAQVENRLQTVLETSEATG
jgi:glycosyltransferase involved in cell wall biosynthesis